MDEKVRTTYETINTSMIYKDSYQRDINVARVKKIVKNFNPNLVNPIKVSLRGGRYYVFDGQHTMAALKMRNNNADVDVECKVFYGLTYEDEARLFSEQNGFSSIPLTRERLKACYEARDIDVVDFVETLKVRGIDCDFTPSPAEGKLLAYGCAYSLYKKTRDKPFVFDDIFIIITSAWPKNSYAMRKEILNGMYVFVSTYVGQLSIGTAVQKFSKISPLTIIRDANVSHESGYRKYAIQLLAAYNKGLKTNRLSEELLWGAAGNR